MGRVSRMPNDRLVMQALLANPTGKWPRCRPRPGRSNSLSYLAWSRLDVEPAELSEIAIDREVFQVLWMLPPQLSLEEKRALKGMKGIFTLVFHRCLKEFSLRVNKFLRRLELINANVKTARNDLPIIHDTFRRKQDVKLCSPLKFTATYMYRYCCVRVIMRPAGYLVSPHVAHRAISIWDPWIKGCICLRIQQNAQHIPPWWTISTCLLQYSSC